MIDINFSDGRPHAGLVVETKRNRFKGSIYVGIDLEMCIVLGGIPFSQCFDEAIEMMNAHADIAFVHELNLKTLYIGKCSS